MEMDKERRRPCSGLRGRLSPGSGSLGETGDKRWPLDAAFMAQNTERNAKSKESGRFRRPRSLGATLAPRSQAYQSHNAAETHICHLLESDGRMAQMHAHPNELFCTLSFVQLDKVHLVRFKPLHLRIEENAPRHGSLEVCLQLLLCHRQVLRLFLFAGRASRSLIFEPRALKSRPW